jgi:putative hydrolase of the HAD superfamily
LPKEDLKALGIKGVILDCYDTLIQIRSDENSIDTYKPISNWLLYQGVRISAEELMREYKREVDERLAASGQRYPEIKVEEAFDAICNTHSIWETDNIILGIEAARTFRSSSVRSMQAFPQSVNMLEALKDFPLALVSNGQRVFSEPELRFLGLYHRFKTVIFSSDVGYQKPDENIFKLAARQLDLAPREILSIGDSMERDILPAIRIGMRGIHIEEAWKLYKLT